MLQHHSPQKKLRVYKIEWHNMTQNALEEGKKMFWFKSVNFISKLLRCQISKSPSLGL